MTGFLLLGTKGLPDRCIDPKRILLLTTISMLEGVKQIAAMPTPSTGVKHHHAQWSQFDERPCIVEGGMIW
ncbi:hypothetical protein MPTK1_1g11850 [Marchantia polymorpha subsp. ruderalis]|uniref:Uncharacterized protein n=2 Tax=Marchantia polymorpha TaxID=3197 RepID=A0AAF6AP57_MARPO|nr:hypothetical protein MARPO_0014s0042 [Marchantia polymorpha]BBM98227.1 hypothetical protein Mp_1g11850 [Marchantia polymorpha subsp. ruderalis]|eukprot:PTQ45493.1 hypothetical protein MARPO_0014s0042 [Marchantia polymorpha]